MRMRGGCEERMRGRGEDERKRRMRGGCEEERMRGRGMSVYFCM